jgi:uncharacterized cupredoxin-like copper-binding protein
VENPSTESAKEPNAGAITAVLFIASAAFAISIAALVIALSNRDHGATSVTPPATSQVLSLTEYKIDVPTSLPAGNVTLQITNNGKLMHELLVFATNLDAKSLPTMPDGTVNEDGPGLTKVSDGDNINAGAAQSRAVDLTKPGTYVFVCNLPGHYALGMYTTVTVS